MVEAISLFSGCGGCSLGLKQAGFEIRLAADIDEDACKTYSLNLGEEITCLDLSEVKPEELYRRSRLNKLDLIVAGPPCQGFSSAGAKDWADPRNTLLRNFVEIAIELKPTWFVMENVEGLLTSGEGYYFIEAITRFLEAGYWVRAKKVYMEQHGIPQKRKRVFIVGNLEQCQFYFPPPVYRAPGQLSLFEQSPQLSLLDAIGDLPEASDSPIVVYDKQPQCDYQARLRRTDGKPVLHHQNKPVNPLTQQRINSLAPGETMKDLPVNLQHPSYRRRALRRVMDGTPTEKRGGAPNGLKRLSASQPSLTITSAATREFIHYRENRLLTLRECARIQSFPDWYEFRGSYTSIATQIGNAIPPLFMKVLATHIIKLATWQPQINSRGQLLGVDATKSSGKSPKLARMLAELKKKTASYAR